MNLITREELQTTLRHHADNNVKLVAVMNEWNFKRAHIANSLNVTSLQQGLEELESKDSIILYCTGWPCLDAYCAYQLLKKHDYRNLRIYSGGLMDWAAAGLPIKRAGSASISPRTKPQTLEVS